MPPLLSPTFHDQHSCHSGILAHRSDGVTLLLRALHCFLLPPVAPSHGHRVSCLGFHAPSAVPALSPLLSAAAREGPSPRPSRAYAPLEFVLGDPSTQAGLLPPSRPGWLLSSFTLMSLLSKASPTPSLSGTSPFTPASLYFLVLGLHGSPGP